MAITGITSAVKQPQNSGRTAPAQSGSFQRQFLQKVEALLDQLRLQPNQAAGAPAAPPKPAQQQVAVLAQRIADLGAQREQALRAQGDVQSNLKNINDALQRPQALPQAQTAARPQAQTQLQPQAQPRAAGQPSALPASAAGLVASDDAQAGAEPESLPLRLAPLASKAFAPGRQTALETARVQVFQVVEAARRDRAPQAVAADAEDQAAAADDAAVDGAEAADRSGAFRGAARAYQATLEAAANDIRVRLADLDARIDATQAELQALTAPSGVQAQRRRAAAPVVSPQTLDAGALDLFTRAREVQGGVADARRPAVKTAIYAVQSLVTFRPRGAVLNFAS